MSGQNIKNLLEDKDKLKAAQSDWKKLNANN